MYLADTISRAYIKCEPDSDFEDDIKIMVHSVINNIPSSPGRLEEIRHATHNDISLQQLSQSCVSWIAGIAKSIATRNSALPTHTR